MIVATTVNLQPLIDGTDYVMFTGSTATVCSTSKLSKSKVHSSAQNRVGGRDDAGVVAGADGVESERDANAVVHDAIGKMLTVHELAWHMITTSSNLATNLVLARVGTDAVNDVREDGPHLLEPPLRATSSDARVRAHCSDVNTSARVARSRVPGCSSTTAATSWTRAMLGWSRRTSPPSTLIETTPSAFPP